MFLEAFSLKPMEGVIPRFNFRIEMWKARNAEEALLAVLNACARVTKATSEIKWQYANTFGAWISRLQGQRVGIENVLTLECLSFLNLQGCILYVRDFIGANLAWTRLERARLAFANLEGANLEGANLTGANLAGVSLEQANLAGAILMGANLAEANLAEANLQGANLQGANLQVSNLYKTNLEGANLAGAILQWANFASANLEEANFEGANLEGTILEGKDIANLAEASNAGSDES
jgi:uncharacterized protein YjbI with pentapeptide repeats